MQSVATGVIPDVVTAPVEQTVVHPTNVQWPIAIASATRQNKMCKRKGSKLSRLWKWFKDNWKGFWEASIYQRKNSCGIDCGCKSKKDQRDGK